MALVGRVVFGFCNHHVLYASATMRSVTHINGLVKRSFAAGIISFSYLISFIHSVSFPKICFENRKKKEMKFISFFMDLINVNE